MQEADFILGRFAERHLKTLSAAQLDRFEALLDNPDPDILNWITGAEAVPAAFDTDIFALLKDFKISGYRIDIKQNKT